MSEPSNTVVRSEERLVTALARGSWPLDAAIAPRERGLPGAEYGVVNELLRDRRFRPPTVARSRRPARDMYSRWLINLDGPRHLKVRRRFVRFFSVQGLRAFRPRVEQHTLARLRQAAPRGAMDVVSELARPLPFDVIADVIGVPDDGRAWMAAKYAASSSGGQTDGVADSAAEALLGYLERLYEERRRHPANDLLSTLAADTSSDVELRRDLLANCIFLLEAGQATSSAMLASAVHLLVEHRDVLDLLRRRPELIQPAVEEVLRLASPVRVVKREPITDSCIRGHHFPAGQRRFLFPAAANRDPESFPAPDVFDVQRTPNRHLAFSAGAHVCLGSPLARLLGEVALGALVRELPGVRRAGATVWGPALSVQQVMRLPVAWDASSAV